MTETAKRPNRKRFFQGTVVSDKMDKTRVVQVRWATKHDKYNKVVRRATKFKAHDEKNESHTGDFVQIMESRPLSKDKRWVVTNVIKSS